jgi:hypothetical protein
MNKREMATHVTRFINAHGQGKRDLSPDEIHELARSMGMTARQLPLEMRGGLTGIFLGGDDNG